MNNHHVDTLLDTDQMHFETFRNVLWDQDLFWVKVYIKDKLDYKDISRSPDSG